MGGGGVDRGDVGIDIQLLFPCQALQQGDLLRHCLDTWVPIALSALNKGVALQLLSDET